MLGENRSAGCHPAWITDLVVALVFGIAYGQFPLAAMTAVHAPLIGHLSRIVGFNPSRVFVEGVASQSILWDNYTLYAATH